MADHKNELEIPEFFKSHNAWFDHQPQTGMLLRAAAIERRRQCVTPSTSDVQRILLLIIDPQKDFCRMEGKLFVAGRSGDGAVKDCARLAEFIHRNAHRLTRVAATLDTHHPFQCFFPEFWELSNGEHPNTHSLIDMDGRYLVNRALTGEVIGVVKPNRNMGTWVYTWLVRQMRHYVRQLKRGGKCSLYLWPHHCLKGSAGHSIVGVVEEAMLYHSFLRSVQPDLIVKGEHPLTENYSVFRPEVEMSHDGNYFIGDDLTPGNRMAWVNQHDAVIVAGQASSHCVKSSVEDIVTFFGTSLNPERTLGKYYLLTDCMSPVVVPGADFTNAADEALKRFEAAGMHLVQSTTPMLEWPDFPTVG